MTFPRSSGWRADLRIVIEKQLGLKSSLKAEMNPASIFKDTGTLFQNNDNGLETPEGATKWQYQRHRIPCGLIVIENESSSSTSTLEDDEDVLPLTTFAVAPTDDAPFSSSSSNTYAISTLHASALSKHPRLKDFVVEVPISSDQKIAGKQFQRMIPEGTFRLRMGSEESTIEKSPTLWIIEDELTKKNKDMVEDLILGNDFWKSHGAEFGSDEVYLYPRALLSEEGATIDERKESRVMVPFLRIRSRPSFGTDDL